MKVPVKLGRAGLALGAIAAALMATSLIKGALQPSLVQTAESGRPTSLVLARCRKEGAGADSDEACRQAWAAAQAAFLGQARTP